jgi:hypothetical protein
MRFRGAVSLYIDYQIVMFNDLFNLRITDLGRKQEFLEESNPRWMMFMLFRLQINRII